MPENSPPTPDSPVPTRTETGTIQDQGTSIPPSTQPPSTTTTPPAQTAKTTDGKPSQSLINEKSPEGQGAPSQYEAFTVPDGFTLDEGVAKNAGELFKSLVDGKGINQSDAQKLVDFYVKETKEAFESPFNAYVEKRQEWRDEINSDPNIGGSKLDGVKASIGRLIDSFGDVKIAQAFREAMDYTGAGDNPAVVRGLYAISKRLTEGAAVRGNGPSTEGQRPPGAPERPSAAQAIYPNLTSMQRS